MPFARKTLSDLIREAQADIAQALGLRALLRWRPEIAMARAMAGLTQGLYGYLDWIALQSTPATAMGEHRAGWAALKGVFPKEATFASGMATFLGTPGEALPTGAEVRLADGSAAYQVTAGATVDRTGTISVPITAMVAGPAGNAPAGAALLLSTAMPGITSAGVADGPLTGGTAAEEVDSDEFHARMLLAYAEPAQGGAAGDYSSWALQVPGVTRAWVSPNGMGTGTVVVRFMMDAANAGSGGFPAGTDGVASDEHRDAPAAGDQLAVANHIFPRRPATALVYAAAPSPYGITVTIEDMQGDTPEIRAAVQASLIAMFRLRGTLGGTIYPSEIAAAIDAVPGVERFTLAFPTNAITAPDGALPVLGVLSWT
ncbi:baseplate J/gp47 family protein [Roseomonas xinghualingensis]|uniref:baseplate J/gp47 family protein n=1 Tax=Roseomonas xinghualingensis TaxID=2986475 RepID=UPI0021F1538F|nr:baseplate J/gp47 family protein [Roseomonas sp. SXEYE001]MCV4207579.1 baseplate J/gp47 family protein [Roseomonas sp. SXEYE001]